MQAIRVRSKSSLASIDMNSSEEHSFLVREGTGTPPASRHCRCLGGHGFGSGLFIDPSAITAGQDRIFVADPLQNCVHVLNRECKFLMKVRGDSLKDDLPGVDDIIQKHRRISDQRKHFSSVGDLATGDSLRYIFLSDPIQNAIHVLKDPSDKSLPNGFSRPPEKVNIDAAASIAGLCVVDDTSLAVADNELGRIFICSLDGIVKSSFDLFSATGYSLLSPHHITYESVHKRLIVSDAANSRVHLYDLNGTHISTLWRKGHFKYPSGIATDQMGNIFVVDQGLHCVLGFDANGSLIHRIGQPGVGIGQLQSPKDAVVLPCGDIVVTDTLNSRLQIFNGI